MKKKTPWWKRPVCWITDGNDCAHCPASWEEASYTDCGTEYDGGCYIFGDEWPEPCRLPLPKFVRAFLSRRQRYLRDHEYDGYAEFIEKLEAGDNVIRDAIEEQLANRFICWKDDTGAFREANKDSILFEITWRSRTAYDKFLQPARLTIRKRWAELIRETIMRPVGFIISYVIGG